MLLFLKKHTIYIEIIIYSIILAACNTHLVTGRIEDALIYYRNSSQWTLFLHPFVHVSFYHFILDAGAFILLYPGLKNTGIFQRGAYALLSGITSFSFVHAFAGEYTVTGFCGMSGIAHGLMAVYSLEMISENRFKKTAFIILAIVSLKSAYEMISGQAVFSSMHMGFCGTPVPASHAGGVIGGAIGFMLCKTANRLPRILQKILRQIFKG